MSKNMNELQYKYRGLVLDEFQQESIWHIQNKTSLLISAPTGTGKTLIADYLIDSCLKNNQQIIYTAPIKALVNQKYLDFTSQFGTKNIGIATGDIAINSIAPLTVMTTEIFRNMLLRHDERINNIHWVIFDELHYLNHQERGTVWEESILLKPNWISILGLSATVPNIQEIADWITNINNEPVSVIRHNHRAVPLKHLYFNNACQAVPRDKLMPNLAEAALNHDDAYDFKGGNLSTRDIQLPRNIRYKDSTRYIDLVRYLSKNRLFPALYFSFSRKGCEEKSSTIAKQFNYLSNREKQGVLVNVRKKLKELNLTKSEIPQLDKYIEQWVKGVGVHHAGMLPVIKQIVETLLQQGLIRVLFTTETFAVGINLPVKTVCFDNLVKFDGKKYRFLTQQEYFQMAGRAGRRGMDKQGTVLSLIDFTALTKNPIPEWEEAYLEPIKSQFYLSYNITLNLTAYHSDSELKELFRKTLAGYQDPQNAQAIYDDFLRKKTILTKLGFLENEKLTAKGQLGCSIFIQELLLSELIFTNALRKFKPAELAGLAACLINDWKPRTPTVPPEKWLTDVQVIAEQIARRAQLKPSEQIEIHSFLAQPLVKWASGTELEDIIQEGKLAPGDFVQLCRRTIDILHQLEEVADSTLKTKLKQAINKIDRGVVKVRF